jgi:hypothetical protein
MPQQVNTNIIIDAKLAIHKRIVWYLAKEVTRIREEKPFLPLGIEHRVTLAEEAADTFIWLTLGGEEHKQFDKIVIQSTLAMDTITTTQNWRGATEDLTNGLEGEEMQEFVKGYVKDRVSRIGIKI